MRLFILFLSVPIIEIALFIQIGGVIGLGWTLLIVVLTALQGTILVRSQGLAVLGQLQASLQKLNDPTEPLVHGAMILFSGALLLTPGFFTDAVGFALLLPGVRGWIFQGIRKRVNFGVVAGKNPTRDTNQSDIIDGEFEDLDRPDGSQRPSAWTRH